MIEHLLQYFKGKRNDMSTSCSYLKNMAWMPDACGNYLGIEIMNQKSFDMSYTNPTPSSPMSSKRPIKGLHKLLQLRPPITPAEEKN